MSNRETLVAWWDRGGGQKAAVRDRLAQADREYAALEQSHKMVCEDLASLSARCDQRQEYIDALTADKETLRKERAAALAELDGVRKERDELRESLAWARQERDELRKQLDADQRAIDELKSENATLRKERDDWERGCEELDHSIADFRQERDALRAEVAKLAAECGTVRFEVADLKRSRTNTAPSRPEPTRLEIAATVAGGMTCEAPWDDNRVLHECADAAWRLAGELLAKALAEAAPGAQEPLTNGKAGKA